MKNDDDPGGGWLVHQRLGKIVDADRGKIMTRYSISNEFRRRVLEYSHGHSAQPILLFQLLVHGPAEKRGELLGAALVVAGTFAKWERFGEMVSDVEGWLEGGAGCSSGEPTRTWGGSDSVPGNGAFLRGPWQQRGPWEQRCNDLFDFAGEDFHWISPSLLPMYQFWKRADPTSSGGKPLPFPWAELSGALLTSPERPMVESPAETSML